MNEGQLERRSFLAGAGLTAAAGALALSGCGRPLTQEEMAQDQAVAPPAEWWRQPSAPVGKHTLLELPYAKDKLVLSDAEHPKVRGISPQVVEWHHDKHHAGYVTALNRIELDLAAMTSFEAKANYSAFSELKRRETFNASGVWLHDLYWLNMLPGGVPLAQDSELHAKIVADWGSLERWRQEFVATANTPNAGWAILALAPYDRKLHNYACSFHDLGGVWGAIPLIACDVWEHAYYYDYGPDRESYVESFLRLLNWPEIDATFVGWARCGAFR